MMNPIQQLIKTTSLDTYPATFDYDPIQGIDIDQVRESAFMDPDATEHILTLLEVVAFLLGNHSQALLEEIHALPSNDRQAVLQCLNQFWHPKPLEEDL